MMSRIHWMFDCREVSKRVSRAQDDPPPIHHRLMIWMHHRMCKYCIYWEKHLEMLRKFYCNYNWHDEEVKPGTGLPDDARARIKSNLKHAL